MDAADSEVLQPAGVKFVSRNKQPSRQHFTREMDVTACQIPRISSRLNGQHIARGRLGAIGIDICRKQPRISYGLLRIVSFRGECCDLGQVTCPLAHGIGIRQGAGTNPACTDTQSDPAADSQALGDRNWDLARVQTEEQEPKQPKEGPKSNSSTYRQRKQHLP